MFAWNPPALASSTNEAENGNHPHLLCGPVWMQRSTSCLELTATPINPSGSPESHVTAPEPPLRSLIFTKIFAFYVNSTASLFSFQHYYKIPVIFLSRLFTDRLQHFSRCRQLLVLKITIQTKYKIMKYLIFLNNVGHFEDENV